MTEFFGYAVNSILYQRGLYPPSTFEVKKKYGLGMLVSSDEEIKNYLVSVLDQINEWLIEKKLEKLVLVISSVRTRETVERWVFDIETDSEIGLEENEENVKPTEGEGKGGEKNKKYEKSKQDITNEIAAIMRQIAASVTFLPLLEDECSFDLIVYTNKDSDAARVGGERPEIYPQRRDRQVTKLLDESAFGGGCGGVQSGEPFECITNNKNDKNKIISVNK